MQDMKKRILERIGGHHQLTGDFNVKTSRSTMNTERSPAPRWNVWPGAMADVLWDKQTLEPFCLGGKDLVVPRQSLQWISPALGSFCILLKLKTVEDVLLHGLWSFPLPQTADAGKPAMSFRLLQQLLSSSWWRGSAMKNYGVSELKRWLEQLIAANTGVWGWSLLVREQKSCKKSWPCTVEREQPASWAWMLSSLGWQIWEFLNKNNSLCWCFCFYCIQENGLWVKFFLPFWGASKQDYFKIMPRVQLTYAADFSC